MDETTTTTTTTTGNTQPVTLDTILAAMREIEMLPKNDRWIVIDPRGRMYRGTVEQVIPVLAAEHPFIKAPISFGAR